MRQINKKIKNSKIYVIYTILFCIICFTIFYIFIKYNKGFIWNVDGFKQHYAILYNFNQVVKNVWNNGFPMISWEMGLGLDFIGQYSYYIIGDIFAYISLLFPIKYLEQIYSFLIILRMYCIGLSFIIYCRYHNKEDTNILIGTLIYTFCGFILYAGIRHPYFINAAILLPLNFLAIDKFFKQNCKSFLIFIVFLSVFSNYYFFYMIAVITGIYIIVQYWTRYNQGIKEFIKKIIILIGCYLVSILMASIILIPTIYAFFSSPRTGGNLNCSYIQNFYSNLFLGFICMRFKNWTVISMCSIILLMMPIILTKLKNTEKRAYSILFIITTAMLMFPHIASMMNGFSFPSNRWIFAYAFILAYIVVLAFRKNLKYNKKQIILMALTLLTYTVIGVICTAFEIKKNIDFYANLSIAIIIFILILLNNFNKTNKWKILNYSYIIVIVLIILNIEINALALYSSKGKGYVTEFLNNNSVEKQYSNLNGKIKDFDRAIQYIKQNDAGFYRISKNDSSNQNASIVYNYKSIQTYLSIGNGDVYNLCCDLEDNKYSTTKCINGMDRRTKITTLLGNKYFICNKKDCKYIPYGYKLYYEIGTTQIYINSNYLNVGLIYDKYITQEEYSKLSSLQKEDALLKVAVTQEKVNGMEQVTDITEQIETPQKVEYKIKEDIVKDNQIKITKENQEVHIKINKIKPKSELYLNIENLKYKSNGKNNDYKISTSFNNIKNSEEVLDCDTSAYYIKNDNFLINLGCVQENTSNELILTFNHKGTYTFDDIELLAVTMENYEQDILRLRDNQMKNIEYGNNFINGEVEVSSNSILQLTTSYSNGWKAYVDGEKVDIIKVNEGFIGIEIPKGKHNIKFKYETPYIKIATMLSTVGITIFILIFICEIKKGFEKRKKLLADTCRIYNENKS